MREKQSLKIKNNLSKYLKMNKEDDRLGEEQMLSNDSKILLFDKLTNDFNIFDESDISSIFADFKNISQIDEPIQKYIEILNTKGHLSLIPTEFINFVISTISKNSFSDNAINCLKYYDRSSLNIDNRKQLAKKLNDIVNIAQSNVQSYSTQIGILNGIKLSLKLMDKDCYDQDLLANFNIALYNFINNLFPHNASLSMDLLVEAMLLVTNEADPSYESLLRRHLMPIDNQNS